MRVCSASYSSSVASVEFSIAAHDGSFEVFSTTSVSSSLPDFRSPLSSLSLAICIVLPLMFPLLLLREVRSCICVFFFLSVLFFLSV